MLEYLWFHLKNNNDSIYTDTDYIFTTAKLDDSLIVDDLGLMKDDMIGLTIKEGYFFPLYPFMGMEGELK